MTVAGFREFVALIPCDVLIEKCCVHLFTIGISIYTNKVQLGKALDTTLSLLYIYIYITHTYIYVQHCI